jgi:hypothetical protein
MSLWINPFLDEFYNWGLGKYWYTKMEFIISLDTGFDYAGYTLDSPGGIHEYIMENVPKWYWEDGFSMDINGGFSSEILDAWQEDRPVLYLPKLMRPDSPTHHPAEEYPKYLIHDGEMLELYPPNKYVKLIQIKNRWVNSLYFTTKQGKSWCNILPKNNFINWISRNPMEVKE